MNQLTEILQKFVFYRNSKREIQVRWKHTEMSLNLFLERTL